MLPSMFHFFLELVISMVTGFHRLCYVVFALILMAPCFASGYNPAVLGQLDSAGLMDLHTAV